MAIGSTLVQGLVSTQPNYHTGAAPKEESIFAGALRRTREATGDALSLAEQLNHLADVIFGQRPPEGASSQSAPPTPSHEAWRLSDAQDQLTLAIRAAHQAAGRLAPLIEP